MGEPTTASAATPPSRPPTPPQPGGATDTFAAARRQLGIALRRSLRQRLAVVSLIVFTSLVLCAFVGPCVWPYDHTIGRDIAASQPPSLRPPFCTTTAGHDVLGQVMRGTQQSLKVALTVALLSTVVGSI